MTPVFPVAPAQPASSTEVSSASTRSPLVSVVVPTHNRPERLRTCLAALSAQDLPRDEYEVIVVDDGSSMPLDGIAEPFRPNVRLTLLRQQNAGPAAARNAGALRAAGALLAFTDDDCEPASDWLSVLWGLHQHHRDALLGGHTINALTGNPCAEASQLLVDYLYDYYRGGEARRSSTGRMRGPRFFTSNNLAASSAIFRAIGGFDVTFPLAAGEDRELCDRWQERGYRLLYAPQARVRHAHALSVRRFWRQHVNYGRGAWHFRHARIRRGSPEVGVEPLSFYINLLLYPFKMRPILPATRLMSLLTVAQAANVVGFWRERRSSRSGAREADRR